MCKFKLFSIAAAALMMVACSNEDLTQQTQTKAGKMQFSATIAASSSGATTRTIYTEDTQNKKITVAWKVGDEIALVHNGVKDVATVKTINSDGSATITGYVTGATDGAKVRLVYPASLVKEAKEVTGDNDGTEYTADETVEGKLKTQGGTLAYIQDNLDFREVKGQLAVNGSEVTLAKKAAEISPLLAIWKLTLSDGTNNLSATQVKIKGGESVLASTTTLTAGTSVVTLAIPTYVFIDGALTIEATVGDGTYAYTKAEGATFNPHTYYQSTVTMEEIWDGDLAKLTNESTAEFATATDGMTITGTLTANVKVSIADGATVTLDGVTINGVNNESYKWAGITCLGDATIILKDGTTNTVKGFHQHYPGIQAGPSGKTLTIKGTGSLKASSNGNGAGIGAGFVVSCGNIEIQDGNITATGGQAAAGIGGGRLQSCGNITITGGTIKATGGSLAAGIGAANGNNSAKICGDIEISGGTVEATGGNTAAGIGSGSGGVCGTVTITSGVTSVTATKGDGAPNSIGKSSTGKCGTVTIGGTVYWDGSAYQNGGDTYLTQSTIFYPVPDPIALSAVTSSQLGWIVGNDGKAYAVEPLPAGVDAVAKIFYVGTTGDATYNHGLALALVNEGKMEWSTAGTTCSGKNTSTPITGAKWLLASKDQWDYMMGANGAGSWSNLKNKAGLINDFYWSSSPGSDDEEAKGIDFYGGNWSETLAKTVKHYVRACLAF